MSQPTLSSLHLLFDLDRNATLDVHDLGAEALTALDGDRNGSVSRDELGLLVDRADRAGTGTPLAQRLARVRAAAEAHAGVTSRADARALEEAEQRLRAGDNGQVIGGVIGAAAGLTAGILAFVFGGPIVGFLCLILLAAPVIGGTLAGGAIGRATVPERARAEAEPQLQQSMQATRDEWRQLAPHVTQALAAPSAAGGVRLRNRVA